MHCCFSTATTVTRTRHIITLHVYVLSRVILPFTSSSSKWSPSIGFPPAKVCILLLRTLPHARMPSSAPFLNSRSLYSSLRARDNVWLAPKTTRKTARACAGVRVCVFCAIVGLDNKLYKMHGTYIKIVFNNTLENMAKQTPQIYQLMHIFIYITIYLAHSSYMFRCAIHYLKGGLLVFLEDDV